MALCGNRAFIRKNELHGTWSPESCHLVMGCADPSSLNFHVLTFPASIFSMFWVQLQCFAFNVKTERESLCGVWPTEGIDLCPPVHGLLQWKPAGAGGTVVYQVKHPFPRGWYKMTYKWHSSLYSFLAKALSPHNNQFYRLLFNPFWIVCSSLKVLSQHPTEDPDNV